MMKMKGRWRREWSRVREKGRGIVVNAPDEGTMVCGDKRKTDKQASNATQAETREPARQSADSSQR